MVLSANPVALLMLSGLAVNIARIDFAHPIPIHGARKTRRVSARFQPRHRLAHSLESGVISAAPRSSRIASSFEALSSL